LVFFYSVAEQRRRSHQFTLLPIPSFTLPALPNITLPPIAVPMPLPVRHLVRSISRNPLTIAALVLGGTFAGVVVAGTIAELIRAVYRSRRTPIETSPTDAS
jgi:hypothetical protein